MTENVLSLQVLESETCLSRTEVENTIKVLERIGAVVQEHPLGLDKSHPDQTRDGNSAEDTLRRLRLAAVSILYRNKKRDKQQLKLTRKLNSKARYSTVKSILNKVKKSNNTARTGPFGIVHLRKETKQKWGGVFGNDNIQPSLPMAIEAPSNLNIDTGQESPVLEKSTTPINYNFSSALKTECYICKLTFSEVHHFYDQLCPQCADLNFLKRSQTANLNGKVALLTGGRLKIGYETGLKLLRCGAMVVITTRFPADAAKRYSSELDFNCWKDRLHIHALDLRFISHVEQFCTFFQRKYSQLDILIQNAAQTIRRPVGFYSHLLQQERCPPLESSSLIHSWQNPTILASTNYPEETSLEECTNLQLHHSTKEMHPRRNVNESMLPSYKTSQIVLTPEDLRSLKDPDNFFPPNCYDDDHQQLDLRPDNSWTLEADQVDTVELVEVNLVNSIAPFIILSKLSPLLKDNFNKNNPSWVILVSAMEGKFNRYKTSKHPHTNCAKASLNMLVRTSAYYYKKFGVLLNAVDTGWVTDESPLPNRADFRPPLDAIDGAARVLDPIFQSLNDNNNIYGKFLKDYQSSQW